LQQQQAFLSILDIGRLQTQAGKWILIKEISLTDQKAMRYTGFPPTCFEENNFRKENGNILKHQLIS